MYLNIECDEYIFADSICIFGCTATDGLILNEKNYYISIWPQPFIPHSTQTHTLACIFGCFFFFLLIKPNRGISGQNRIVCRKYINSKAITTTTRAHRKRSKKTQSEENRIRERGKRVNMCELVCARWSIEIYLLQRFLFGLVCLFIMSLSMYYTSL